MPKQSCSEATTTSSRRISSRCTSNNFNRSTSLDEDWVKVSDMAERRKIQNRIAQRNYRKRLKLRREDLKRMADTSSTLLPQTHEELHHQQDCKESVQNSEENSEIIHQQPSPTVLQSQRTKPMEDSLTVGQPFEREESSIYPSYGQRPYRPVPTVGGQLGGFPVLFPPPLPSTMYPHRAVKPEDYTVSQFNICHLEIGHVSHGYEHLDPHNPSILQPYNPSSGYSESGYSYDTTGDGPFSTTS